MTASAVAEPTRTLEATAQRRRSTRLPSAERNFRIATAALVVLTVLSRLPFMTRTLYAFDSANYALAVRDVYNVAFHQPHPPGYPLYVFFAKVIDLVVRDANRALILEGIVWSAIAVLCTVLLARAWFGRSLGLLAGLLLACTVGFWGYGEVAYPYVALAGETALLAWLANSTLAGHRTRVVWMGVAWAISAGVRWDAAVFCTPLWLWALWSAPWRQRLASVGLAVVVVEAWAVPMIQLTGGWDAYRQTLTSYLQVWSAQSAYVLGDFASGGNTQVRFNLNFLVDYLRQMLGAGTLLVLYIIGRRFGPAPLATDQRTRFLMVWTMPPLLVYVYAHLGEAGYVLSLAPQAAILVALAAFDLGEDAARAVQVGHARGWRWLPRPRAVGLSTTVGLATAIVLWNMAAFTGGVGPGRWPDLRAHDATTSAQVEYLRQQPAATTFVLAHDILRQLAFYQPGPRVELLYSEYVPNFQQARTQTELPAGTDQIVVLDGPLKVEGATAREVVLNEQPRVTVTVVDTHGARAIEHGYQFLRVL
jgi:hypothetical protein